MSAFKQYLRKFCTDTSGAITVEWVLMVAAGVSIGLAATSVVGTGLDAASTDIDRTLSETDAFDSLWTWGNKDGTADTTIDGEVPSS